MYLMIDYLNFFGTKRLNLNIRSNGLQTVPSKGGVIQIAVFRKEIEDRKMIFGLYYIGRSILGTGVEYLSI